MRIDLLAPSAIVRIKACSADLAAACIVSTYNNIDSKDLKGRTLRLFDRNAQASVASVAWEGSQESQFKKCRVDNCCCEYRSSSSNVLDPLPV